MFKLIIEDDEGHTTIVPLVKDEITIGRKEGNTIRLTERNVSRHHARLLRSNGSFFIEDLDSYNGVRVNGDRITNRTTIREGDLVEIGDYHLALQRVSEKEAPPPAAAQTPPPVPAPSAPDGATAILKLPVGEKPVAEKGRVRPIPTEQVARLLVTTTELEGQQFVLNQTEMTIGRTEENDIVIPHRSVSAVHAKIVFDGGVYRILDMDSANGVLVNGEEYVRVDLRRGDMIELGHIKLRFLAPGDKLPAGPKPEVATAPAFPAAEGMKTRFPLKWLLVAGLPVLAAVGLFVYLQQRQGEEKVVAPPPPAATQPAEVESTASRAAELYREGVNRSSQGDFAGALEKLEAVYRLDPGYPGLQTMLERVRQSEKDKRLVAEARAAVDQSNWDDAWDLYNKISAESHLAREIEGERDEVRKRVITLHLNKAARALESKETQELARRELKKVLEIDPNNLRAADLMKKMERGHPAEKVAMAPKPVQPAAAPRRPTVHNAWEAAGVSLDKVKATIKAGRFREAISDLEKVLKFNPHDCNALLWMGAAYAYYQQKTVAAKYYRSFVENCPNDKNVPSVRNILKTFEESVGR